MNTPHSATHVIYWLLRPARKIPILITLADGRHLEVRIRRGPMIVLRILAEARETETGPVGGYRTVGELADAYAKIKGLREFSEFGIREYVHLFRRAVRKAVNALADDLPVPEIILTEQGVGYRLADCKIEIVDPRDGPIWN